MGQGTDPPRRKRRATDGVVPALTPEVERPAIPGARRGFEKLNEPIEPARKDEPETEDDDH